MKVKTYTDIECLKKLLLDGMFTNPDWGFFRIRTLKDHGTFINIEDLYEYLKRLQTIRIYEDLYPGRHKEV